MPKSRSRNKSDFTPPRKPVNVGSPFWLVPVMCALLIIGLAWIVVYYVSSSRFPVPGVEHWNLLIGFALILAGFVMSTKWK